MDFKAERHQNGPPVYLLEPLNKQLGPSSPTIPQDSSRAASSHHRQRCFKKPKFREDSENLYERTYLHIHILTVCVCVSWVKSCLNPNVSIEFKFYDLLTLASRLYQPPMILKFCIKISLPSCAGWPVYLNLTQARDVWEEKTSTEKMLPPDWPACGQVCSAFPWLIMGRGDYGGQPLWVGTPLHWWSWVL